MINYNKESIELLHLIEERTKGIPIITLFEFESQNYKYGKELYCNVIKKQIEDAFEFTSLYADRELNMSFDDYVGFCILDPDSETELKALNELLEYLQNNSIGIEQTTKKKDATNNIFTALQWSSIFYYVEPDLYGEIQLKKDKLTKFIKDFNVKISHNGLVEKISHNSLSNNHNEIVRVIHGDNNNELTQHHVDTIKTILPYLEKKNVEAFKDARKDFLHLSDNFERKEK